VDIRDRAAGSLLGLALGDALGAPFEFRRARDVPDPIPAFELPWMGFPPGSTTDDTAMARNLARSLASRGRFVADDILARHLEWLRTDPPDVGFLTGRVLRAVGRGVPAEEAARAIWLERGPEVSAGNGSVMYCPPLGAAYAGRPGDLFELAPRLSSLTHVDERCRTAVLAVTLAVARVVGGATPMKALRSTVAAVVDREGGEELEFLVDAVGRTRPVDGPDRSFCLYAAAAGLQSLALHPEAGFEPSLRRVVSLGGDTGTNAGVAGAIVGAVVGRAGFPKPWLERLAGRAEIEREADALGSLAAVTNADDPRGGAHRTLRKR
jgi:ADP-ribosylglycohydrolase